MRLRISHTMLALAALALSASAAAAQGAGPQAPADPSARLREVLPPDVAAHVLAVIADARAHGLPAGALEQRALKFAARGVPPEQIAQSVAQQASRQAQARTLLASARDVTPPGSEIEAAADALREGVSGSDVSALAKSAPSGRALTVPLYVLGSLTARGLPSDQALAQVQARLAAGASDAALASLPQPAQDARNGSPGEIGRAIGAARAPAGTPAAGGTPGGGPPSGVPANAGGHGRPPGTPAPTVPGRPGKP